MANFDILTFLEYYPNKSKHEILSVITQPPQKKLRGQKILPSPIQKAAERLKIPFRTPSLLH